MKTRSLIVLAVLAAAFTWGVLHLFGVEFAAGDAYPQFSSLRADPLGARLLYESLEHTPGLTVSRNFTPLELSTETGATVLILGLDPVTFGKGMNDLRALQKLAERGNRVVGAMALGRGVTDVKATKLNREWGVRFAVDSEKRLYISRAEDWRAVSRTMVERAFGSGSVVLMASSADFANQSTVAMDRLDEVTAVIGRNSRVIFDEQHFGMQESGSVVALARRFRLTGMAIGLAVCAALWIWRSSSAFPPLPRGGSAERLWGRTARSGLVTLLRRHIAAKDLMPLCWQEWFATHRNEVPPERAARAREIASTLPPVAAAREIAALVARKGSL